MRRDRIKQPFKLRLLAFVLALALFWYLVNPSPGPVTRIRREDDLPDEKKREIEPQLPIVAILPTVFRTQAVGPGYTPPSPNQDDDDDFDWPEFIDG